MNNRRTTRKAIILSLGMLMQRVDPSRFIDLMTLFGRSSDDYFKLTPAIMNKTLAVAYQFNLGQIDRDKFADSILQILNIPTLEKQKFWDAWNSIIQVGEINDKMKLLQSAAQISNATYYLYSDTNLPHLEFIEQKCGYKVEQTTSDASQPATFNNMPLYASCLQKRPAQELLEKIVTDIKQKQNNIPESVTLILANPANIEDVAMQARAQQRCDKMTAWCKENDITLVLHDYSLRETLFNLTVDDMCEQLNSEATPGSKLLNK